LKPFSYVLFKFITLRILGRRLEAARKLQAERKARNEAIELSDCLQFCDKWELVLRCPPGRAYLGFRSKRMGQLILEEAEELRNKLAHAQDLVSGSSWQQVIRIAAEVEALLERGEPSDIRRLVSNLSLICRS
jgi:hypothetical protein